MKEEDTPDGVPGTSSKRRRALGRGLDALLSGSRDASIQEIAVERIERNSQQPRQHFEAGALEELAGSIRLHGVVQPLVVSRSPDDRYRLIVGERRWQAARLAGLERVPAVIREASEREVLELALVENVQRADLNAFEEAAAYHRLAQDFGLTQAEVARQVGKSRAAVANKLRLLSLPLTVQQAVIEGRISEGHARALLTLANDHVRNQALDSIEKNGLSVRQTEDLVHRLTVGTAARRTRTVAPDVVALETELRRSLGTKVLVRPGRRGGKIVIEYYSDDDFQLLYERLLVEPLSSRST